MFAHRHLWLATICAASAAISPGSAWAQHDRDQADSSGKRHSVRRPVQDDKVTDADRTIARILGNLNQVEASLASFAEGRSQQNMINRFARKQSQEHEEYVRQLQQFASDAGSGVGNSEDSHEQATSDSDKSRSSGLDMQKVGRELANENYRTAKKELRQQKGLDFDWAFVSQQKMMHDALCADLTVLRRYASSSLREVLDDQLAGIKQDQQTLDQLIDRLKADEDRERGSSHEQHSDRGNDQRSSQASQSQVNQHQQAGQDQGNPRQSGQHAQRGNAQDAYLDEYQFAEADFTATVRLGTDQNGRPSLGIRVDRNQSDRAAIASVRPDGPAAQAGLQAGDVIVAVNGRAVNSTDDLTQAVSQAKPGSNLQLVVDRSEFGHARIPLGGGDESRGQASGAQQPDRSGRSDQQGADNRGQR